MKVWEHPLAIVGAGVVLVVFGVYIRVQSLRSRSWPTAPGVITESRVDSSRQRDLSEIGRLKQNNDTMRQRLLATVAERDHYLAALKRHGIDPGPVPTS